jgi:hypothetical protein
MRDEGMISQRGVQSFSILDPLPTQNLDLAWEAMSGEEGRETYFLLKPDYTRPFLLEQVGGFRFGFFDIELFVSCFSA